MLKIRNRTINDVDYETYNIELQIKSLRVHFNSDKKKTLFPII